MGVVRGGGHLAFMVFAVVSAFLIRGKVDRPAKPAPVVPA